MLTKFSIYTFIPTEEKTNWLYKARSQIHSQIHWNLQVHFHPCSEYFSVAHICPDAFKDKLHTAVDEQTRFCPCCHLVGSNGSVGFIWQDGWIRWDGLACAARLNFVAFGLKIVSQHGLRQIYWVADTL